MTKHHKYTVNRIFVPTKYRKCLIINKKFYYLCTEKASSMITTNIQVEPYLAQWLTAKYYDGRVGAVRFPPHSDLYEKVYDVMAVRPEHVSPIDVGNLCIALPDKRDGNFSFGKNPEKYNYISAHGARILNKRFKCMFWAEVHELMDENKHLHGIDYQDTAYLLVRRYDLSGISDEGLLKNYQRWKDKMRRSKKRDYKRRK